MRRAETSRAIKPTKKALQLQRLFYLSFPRKRESNFLNALRALDARFRGHDSYFDLSSAFRMASVIAVVPTLVMPGCMMSPVR